MKNFSKILSFFVAVILLSSLVFSANAAGTVGFNAGNTSTKNNRIFSIPISGNGNEILSAVKFVFEYDATSIDYRKINVTNQNSIVKEVSENGKLSLIFLNEKGIDLSNGQQLFTIDFKAENMSKNQEISFSVYDCVNNRVESVNASGGKCLVTYLGNAEDDEDSGGNSSKRTGRTSSNGDSGNSNSDNEKYENSDNNSGFDDYGDGENIDFQNEQNDDDESNILKVLEKDNTLKIFLAGAIIVIVLIIIGGVLYHLGRKSKEKENSVEQENAEQNENDNTQTENTEPTKNDNE